MHVSQVPYFGEVMGCPVCGLEFKMDLKKDRDGACYAGAMLVDAKPLCEEAGLAPN